MNRLYKWIGFLVWIAFIMFASIWLFQNYPKIIKSLLISFGVLFIVIIIARIYYGKNWILGIGGEFFVGSDLISAIENYLKERPYPKIETTANLVGHVIYRFSRLGVMAMIITLIPILLLYQQNSLLSQQNKRIDTQNDRINIQNNLMEAERRSSLVFLMSNILDKVDEEIKEQQKILNQSSGLNTLDARYSLSKPLINRIVALSKAFKPYRVIQGDTLSSFLVSPERGQLFISLMENALDSATQNTIVSKGNFSNSEIGNSFLKEKYLSGGLFEKANLKNVIFEGADLSGTNLSGADLSGADLSGVNLKGADLKRADLRGADLRGANLTDANLEGVDLSYAQLFETDLTGTNLCKSILYNVRFYSVNLTNASIGGARFISVMFFKTNFKNLKFDDCPEGYIESEFKDKYREEYYEENPDQRTGTGVSPLLTEGEKRKQIERNAWCFANCRRFSNCTNLDPDVLNFLKQKFPDRIKISDSDPDDLYKRY